VTRYVPQWLQSGTYAASLDRRLIGALWPAPACSGCAVTAAGVGMDLHVDAGQVAVPSPNGTGSVLCTSDAIETVTPAPAPPAGTDRVDLIVCQPRSMDLDGVSNQEDFIFAVVAGAEGAPPGAPPAVPAGTVALAQVHVAGGSASLTAANITDRRPSGLAVPAPLPDTAPRGLVASKTNPSTVDMIAYATAFTCPFTAQPGRKYLINLWVKWSQVSANGGVTVSLREDAAGFRRDCAYGGPMWTATAGNYYFQSCWAFYPNQSAVRAAAPGLMMSSSAGAARLTAGDCEIAVQDVGKW
jgi:hypothetical protein